jgi:hypothetical protein
MAARGWHQRRHQRTSVNGKEFLAGSKVEKQQENKSIQDCKYSLWQNEGCEYLVHETRSAENAESILNSGKFITGQNKNILDGVYAIRKEWYTGNIRGGTALKIKIKPETKVFDNGADRPMEALVGLGNTAFSTLWAKIMSTINDKYSNLIEQAQTINDTRNLSNLWGEAVEDLGHNLDTRAKFMQLLKNELLSCRVGVYQNGGETTIIDLNAIESIERL